MTLCQPKQITPSSFVSDLQIVPTTLVTVVSATINVDQTAPVVTVSRGSADDTFQANDNDSSPTTWAYVLITNNTCNSTTNFSGSTSYTEGDDVVPTEADNTKQICFRSTDSSGNHGYGVSDVIDIDVTPPTVTVSRGSADDTFQANDNDSSATSWAYVLITNNTCNSTTSFSGSSSYTEGDDVVPTEADNTKRLCFRSTDSSGNHGYASSATISVDQTAPVVTVSRGSADDTFQANDNDNGTTSWAYVLITNNSCGSGTNFNNSSSYTEGDDVVPTEADNTKQLCFRSTDSSGNHGYGSSTTINVDQTAPTVTVSRGSADDTFQANDNDSSPTTWAYVLITNTTCNSTTSFSGSSSYTEGDDVVPTEADNTKQLCFRSTDSSGNHGYGSSTTINVDQTAPVVTVSRGSADETFQANDDDSSPTTWAYVLITNNSCGSGTNFSGSTSYTEGDDVVPTEADNTKQLCFRSTDNSDNAGYGSSTTINVDQTAPVVTVSRGSAANQVTATATDDVDQQVDFEYQFISSSTACDDSLTSGFTSYSGAILSLLYDQKACFRATDDADNAAYKASEPGVDISPPQIILDQTIANQVSATTSDTDSSIASFDYQIMAATDNCDDSLTSGFTSYNGAVLSLLNNQKACFRAVDSVPAANSSYQDSQVGVDPTPAVITVSDVVDNQVSATATDPQTTIASFKQQLIDPQQTCGASLTNLTAYSSGSVLSLDYQQRACFEATNGAGQTSYASSTKGQDISPPVISVEPLTSNDKVKATVLDNIDAQPEFEYQFVSSSTACDDSLTTGFSGYSSQDLQLAAAQRACFKATDQAGNSSYKSSDAAPISTTVTSLPNTGSPAGLIYGALAALVAAGLPAGIIYGLLAVLVAVAVIVGIAKARGRL